MWERKGPEDSQTDTGSHLMCLTKLSSIHLLLLIARVSLNSRKQAQLMQPKAEVIRWIHRSAAHMMYGTLALSIHNWSSAKNEPLISPVVFLGCVKGYY